MCLDDWQVKDRKIVGERMKAHVAAQDTTPLLIFPEGTCVNNEYCVMFKRGAFDLGATVCPVAIKYNKIFVDAFWNSRRQSFTNHLVGFGALAILLHIVAACMLCNVMHVKEYLPSSHRKRLCMLQSAYAHCIHKSCNTGKIEVHKAHFIELVGGWKDCHCGLGKGTPSHANEQ